MKRSSSNNSSSSPKPYIPSVSNLVNRGVTSCVTGAMPGLASANPYAALGGCIFNASIEMASTAYDDSKKIEQQQSKSVPKPPPSKPSAGKPDSKPPASKPSPAR